MRFYLVNVHSDGYACRAAFTASSLAEAAKTHLDAYRATRGGTSLVLRSADGRRHSVNDSTAVLEMAARLEAGGMNAAAHGGYCIAGPQCRCKGLEIEQRRGCEEWANG